MLTAISSTGQSSIHLESNLVLEGDRSIYSQNETTGSFIRFLPDQGIELKGRNGTAISMESDLKFKLNLGILNGLNNKVIAISKDPAYGINTPVRFFETLSFGTLHILPSDPHLTAEDYLELRYNADNDSATGFRISKGLANEPDGTHEDVLSINDSDDLVVEMGDLYTKSQGKGLILVSPDGQCHRLTVANSGALETANVSCPD